MIYLDKNSSTPPQKVNFKNSWHQSFPTLLKLLTVSHICGTSEERDCIRNLISFLLFTEEVSRYKRISISNTYTILSE